MAKMKRWTDNLWLLIPILVCAVVVILASPYLISAYHLEAGGRLLDTPSLALEHLDKAIEWDPNNAQAHRLLAKTQLEQRNWHAAVEALNHYSQLRPGNPLGHLESAQLCEALEAVKGGMYRRDLTEMLSDAEVSAAALPVDTHQTQQDGPVQQSFDTGGTSGLSLNYDQKATITMPPSSQVTFAISLPDEPVVFRFEMVPDPELQKMPRDGTAFLVLVNGKPLFSEYPEQDTDRQSFSRRTVDLAPWVRQEVLLTLAAQPAPASHSTRDLVRWRQPEIVDARVLELESLCPESKVAEEWRRAGITAEDFNRAGEAARSSGQPQQAEEWYARAVRLEPGWEKPYQYLQGTLRGDQIALDLLRTGSVEALEKVTWVRPSDLYANYHLWKHAQQAEDMESASEYRSRLTHFSWDAIAPADERVLDWATRVIPALLDEKLWSRGMTNHAVSLLVSRYYASDSVEALLKRLIEQYPSEPEWSSGLGRIYHLRGDFELAALMHKQALEKDPSSTTTYRHLGMSSEAACGVDPAGCEGLRDAAKWYRLYYLSVPDDPLALKQLADVCTELEQAGTVEHNCQAAAEQAMASNEGMAGSVHSPAQALWSIWQDQVSVMAPAYPVGQTLDRDWTLVGYDVDEELLVRGGPVDVLLFWEGPARADVDTQREGWYQAGERWVQVLSGVENLLLNGGFQMGVLGFPHDIYGTDPATRRLAADVRTGMPTTVALLANTETQSRTSFVSQWVPVQPEALYLQSGWIRTEGGRAYLGRRWAGDTPEKADSYGYTAAGVRVQNWQHFAEVIRPPQDATQARIRLLNSDSEGQAYFDNVVFIEIESPP